jgi:hypothetical protein
MNTHSRVASAVGEGSVVISNIHRYLAQRRLDFPEQVSSTNSDRSCSTVDGQLQSHVRAQHTLKEG